MARCPDREHSLADLKRFPTVSRTYFMECSATTGSELMKANEPTLRVAGHTRLEEPLS